MKKNILEKFISLRKEVESDKRNGFFSTFANAIDELNEPNENDSNYYVRKMLSKPEFVITVTEDLVTFKTPDKEEEKSYYNGETLSNSLHMFFSRNILKGTMPSNIVIFRFKDDYSNCSKVYDLVSTKFYNNKTCIVRCSNMYEADIVADELRNVFGYNYATTDIIRMFRK